MNPNEITSMQFHYYVDMFFFIVTMFGCPFVFTFLVYVVFMHIQFILKWIANFKTPQAVRYWAFVMSKLKQKHVWAVMVLIPICLNLWMWRQFSKIGHWGVMGPGPGIQVLTQAMEADRFVVRPSGHCLELPDNEDKVFETGEPNEIREFVKLFSFVPTWKGMYCNCGGELGFEFYKKNEVCLAFSFHHGTHIRVRNQSVGDIYLSDDSERALDKWLTEKGIWQRQKEWEKNQPVIYADDYQVQKDSIKTPVDPNSDKGRLLIQ
jgi:hypothetical protein